MSEAESDQATILVTGGAGFIGSALVARLLSTERRVRVFDPLLYGAGPLRSFSEHPRFELRTGSPLDAKAVAAGVDGANVVVHLGAIVGDAACALDPALTHAFNVDATQVLIEGANRGNVHRLIFASTCSVYGAGDRELDENAPLAPKSLYAASKIAGERLTLSARDAEPVVLRFGTVFGWSRRPRFDLVVNLLTAKAAAGEPISIHGGEQWRPFVHVDDVAAAIQLAIDAETSAIAGEVFNVGSARENRQLREIGDMIRELVPDARVDVEAGAIDHRDYRADFGKVATRLGFRPEWSLHAGVADVLAQLRAEPSIDYRDAAHHNDRALTMMLSRRAPSREVGKIRPD